MTSSLPNNFERKPIDVEQYIKRVQNSPCFICEIVSKNTENIHHIIYEDELTIVFLNKYPVLYGYVLVAPKKHLEHVTSDLTLDEYLNIQKIVYFVSEALKQVVKPERMYILSLGSQQGNSHLHWHVAPLPPNVPYKKQQFEALMSENGILDISYNEMATLATKIKNYLKIILK